MKKTSFFAILFSLALSVFMISCTDNDTEPTPQQPEATLLSDFWFGYYQEDVLSNPEDPLPGFIYLQIPESGTFDGELYFSYSGCAGGIDLGRVRGIAFDGDLDGAWEGNVDGIDVGGNYSGQLVNAERYEGTYTNATGKVEIECDPDFSYFVAPNGTWSLQKSGNNEALNISVDTSAIPLSISWDSTTNEVLFYSIVFADAECLEQNLNLEQCLMWSAVSISNSLVYGQSLLDNVPAEPLIVGQSYLASISCINASGEVTVSSNIIFVR